MDTLKRFYSHTRPVNGCLEWTGAKSRGYGKFKAEGKLHRAHRWLMVYMLGRQLESAEVVMHTCDNTACVSIMHLRVGTHKENTQDMIAKGRHVSPFRK